MKTLVVILCLVLAGSVRMGQAPEKKEELKEPTPEMIEKADKFKEKLYYKLMEPQKTEPPSLLPELKKYVHKDELDPFIDFIGYIGDDIMKKIEILEAKAAAQKAKQNGGEQ